MKIKHQIRCIKSAEETRESYQPQALFMCKYIRILNFIKENVALLQCCICADFKIKFRLNSGQPKTSVQTNYSTRQKCI